MVYTPPSQQLRQWPTPNYVDPERRGPELIVVNSIFLAFATVFIALRLYTRLFVRKWFGIDDIFILLAYVYLSTVHREHEHKKLTQPGRDDSIQWSHC